MNDSLAPTTIKNLKDKLNGLIDQLSESFNIADKQRLQPIPVKVPKQ